jgi:hypothetical protein
LISLKRRRLGTPNAESARVTGSFFQPGGSNPSATPDRWARLLASGVHGHHPAPPRGEDGEAGHGLRLIDSADMAQDGNPIRAGLSLVFLQVVKNGTLCQSIDLSHAGDQVCTIIFHPHRGGSGGVDGMRV